MEYILSDLRDRLTNLRDMINLREALNEDEDDIQVSCYRNIALMSLSMLKAIDGMKQTQVEVKKLANDFTDMSLELQAMNHKAEDLDKKLPCPLLQPSNDENAPKSPKVTEEKSKAAITPSSAKKKPSSKRQSKPIPQIAYITGPEYNAVPKYMKGRMLYSEINKAVDTVNSIATEKFKIINKHRHQNDFERQLKFDYTAQLEKDRDNVYFITEEDMKNFASVHADRHFLSMITVLRHCGRVKQRRVGRLTKYVLILR